MIHQCATGEYRSWNGVTIVRPKQRTYQVLHEGFSAEFTGQSMAEAWDAMLGYVAGLRPLPIGIRCTP